MKINDVKHNHSLTDLLKVLIFSILMITPLLSVATRCLYVICNKNAYQSAETSNIIELKKIVNYTSLIEDEKYQIQYQNTGNAGQGSLIKYKDISISWSDYDDTIINSNVNAFRIAYIAGDNRIYLFNNDTQIALLTNIWGTTLNGFQITFDTGSAFSNWGLGNYEVMYITYEKLTLDNTFEYSVNKLAQSPIISWTQQTAVYTGVNAMTSQLGVNMPTIPMLITYWFLLTIIYVILDIVLKLFTILTHMIGGKKSN